MFLKTKKGAWLFFYLSYQMIFFARVFFIIEYILRNKIVARILVNTCTIRYSFIDEKVTKIVCQVFEMEL